MSNFLFSVIIAMQIHWSSHLEISCKRLAAHSSDDYVIKNFNINELRFDMLLILKFKRTTTNALEFYLKVLEENTLRNRVSIYVLITKKNFKRMWKLYSKRLYNRRSTLNWRTNLRDKLKIKFTQFSSF